MSQAARWNVPTAGPATMAAYSARDSDSLNALRSAHKGPAQPDYRAPGMLWLDDSTEAWTLRWFDGADWIVEGTLDPETHVYTPSIAGLTSGSVAEEGGRLVAARGYAASGVNRTVGLVDRARIIALTATVTVTMASAAVLTAGWFAEVVAVGGDLTIAAAAGETINGLSSIVVPQGASALIAYQGPTALFARIAPSDIEEIGRVIDYAGVRLPSGRYRWADGRDISRASHPIFVARVTWIESVSRGAGLTTVAWPDTSELRVGMRVSGVGVPGGTVIASINTATQFSISNPFSSSGTSDLMVAPYGVGNGTTTINVPDRRGRVGVGRDDMGGGSANRLTGQSGGVNGDVLGAAGGAETHTLTVGQMPRHRHNFFDQRRDNSVGAATGGNDVNRGNQPDASNTGYAGGDQAHNNVQPSQVTNFMVRVQ